MKSKTLVGGLIGGVISFLLGWLIFGVLLHDYYQANTIQYTWLYKANPVLWALIIANLSWGLLLAVIMDAAGANSITKGFSWGFMVFLLMALGFDMLSVGLMNLIKIRLALVDTAVNALFGGVIGAVIGWWYSRSVKTA